MFTPSTQQASVIGHARTGEGNAIVLARAGSGKTTAIEHSVRSVVAASSRRPMIGVFQFNADIAKASQKRMGDTGADIRTLHSYGFAAVRRALGKGVSVDDRKVEKILDRIVPEDTPNRYRVIRAARQLVGLSRASLATTPEAVDAIADAHDTQFPPGDTVRADVIGYVGQALDVCARADGNVIDFDDMCWLPIVHDLAPALRYDLLFIDETQDLSPCQIQLVLGASSAHTRIVAVGDDRQSIYAFRGADSSAVARVQTALQARLLPLTVTYRCARSIVTEANAYVPDLESAPNAPDGIVRSIADEKLLGEVKVGDYILSRTNAPLITACLALLAQRIPATVAGRDVAAALIAAIESVPGDTSVSAFLATWEAHTLAEITRLEKAGRDTTYVVDKLQCLEVLCAGEASLDAVKTKIRSMFGEATGAHVLLSTVHRAKGGERDRVFLLRSTFDSCAARARTNAQRVEEENLMYVGITRARHELVYVT